MDKFLEELWEKLGGKDFYERNGVVIRKSHGDEYECDCPFCHKEKHFYFNARTSQYICNNRAPGSVCGKKGNFITFYADLKAISNRAAYQELCRIAGMEPPAKKPAAQRSKAPASKPNKPAKKEDKPSGAPINTTIYQRLIELTRLTDADRAEMKKKRGFSDETIDAFKFRSGGEYMREVFAALQKEFSASELVASGVCVLVNGNPQVNRQLTDERIIIPYLDENGQVYHIRPHKLGFKGLPAQPYCRALVKDRPEQIILTEGEFKAVALHQWGIPALAEPGTSSFIGGSNLERFVGLLKEFQVKRVVIIFDNEIKSDPAFPNFKEKLEDRFDTQAWAYVMARKLQKAGFTATIGWLPDEWRVQGKVDFDQALAQGHTRQEIEKVIAAAVGPEEFVAGQPEEAQRIIRKKANRHFTRQNISRDFNRYVVKKFLQGQEVEEIVSNFVINIKATFNTPAGVIRNVELVNEYGEKSAVFEMEPGSMSGVNEFRKFVLGKGNYIFKGTAADLTAIWEYEFARDSGEFIYVPDRIGHIESDLWLFGNLAVKGGKTYYPDDDGVVWIDGKGYKPQPVQLTAAGEVSGDSIPSLRTEKIDFKELAYRLKSSVGGYEAYIGLGMVVATIFSQEIFKTYRFFPYLFAYGRAKSGKTTFLAWLMNCFGIETQGVMLPGGTTPVYITRHLAYHSSLGAWFDEYRNDREVAGRFDGLLRAAYNRQFAGKGTATQFQTRGFTVRSAVFLSGEFLPKDPGLFSRLVPIQFSQYKRSDEFYDWANENCRSWSALTYYLITNYEKLKPTILKSITAVRKILAKQRPKIDERIFGNWAIPAGAFYAVIDRDDDFIEWVINSCKEMRQASEDENALNQFWNDVAVLVARGEITGRYMKSQGGRLYVWLPAVYKIWAESYQKENRKDPVDRLSLLKYIVDEPYFCEKEHVIKLKGAPQRCLVLDVDKAPDTIKEIAENVASVDFDPIGNIGDE